MLYFARIGEERVVPLLRCQLLLETDLKTMSWTSTTSHRHLVPRALPSSPVTHDGTWPGAWGCKV
eukprot:2143947-Amphidinium_carterae.1